MTIDELTYFEDELEGTNTAARTLEETPDAGPAKTAPTVPGGLATERGRAVALPENNFPPAGAWPIDRFAQAVIPSSGFGGNRLAVVTIAVPANTHLRLDALGQGADTAVAFSFVRWYIMINGSPAPEYNAVPFQLGTLQAPCPIFLHVQGIATVTLEGENTDPTNFYNMIGRFKGWLFVTMED